MHDCLIRISLFILPSTYSFTPGLACPAYACPGTPVPRSLGDWGRVFRVLPAPVLLGYFRDAVCPATIAGEPFLSDFLLPITLLQLFHQPFLQFRDIIAQPFCDHNRQPAVIFIHPTGADFEIMTKVRNVGSVKEELYKWV